LSDAVNPIVRFSVERRVTMGMMVLGVFVLGWISLLRLPLEFLPSFSASNISVTVPYGSSSPQEVERLIVRPLEDTLGTINGLDLLSSSSSSSAGRINLTFVDGTDMELAAVEVRDRIDRARAMLPPDVERVQIRRFQTSDIPVLRTSVAAPWDRDRLYAFLEDVVQPRLERLEGVAQVSIWGLRSRELQVNLVPSRLAAHGLDVRDLATALRANHVNVAGGYLREGSRRLLVRTVGELHTLDEIRSLPVNERGLRLGDLAEVAYEYPRQEELNFLNGREALYIGINKTSGANLLEVVNRVKGELEAIRQTPKGAGLEVRHFHDTSQDVKDGLTELSRAGLVGGVLAIVFMFFFLRKVRTTLLVAIAVPLSLITTFVIMYLSRQAGISDMTLNVMSLMGLMLAIGMLLDNSIVVIESIFRHRQELGEDARTAALLGASEVAMPIIASTATTMCVFFPLIFLSSSGGGFSRFMIDIGVTVCVVMLASLVVSLTVVPMVAAILLRTEGRRRAGLLERWIGTYGRILRFTLHHRLAFAIAIALTLWGSWKMYMGIERAFAPPSEGRQITLFVDTPRRYSVEERAGLFDEIYELLEGRRQELEIADIVHQFGRGGGRSRGRGGGGGNRFEIYLTPEETARLRTSEVQDRIRELLPLRAGVTFKTAQTQAGRPGSTSSGISVDLIGDDMQILELLTSQVASELESLPMLEEVDSSLESGDEEIHLSVDRERAMQVGLSSQAVAQTVSTALSGRALTYVKTEDREVGLVMQYREQDRATLEQLQKLPIYVDGAPLPIGSLTSFSMEPGARTIERENRRSKITVSANAAGETPGFALMRPVSSVLGSMSLPPGYEWTFDRRVQEAQEDASGASFALILAAVLIYMIMASLFESFVQPFTIMFSIPFAFIGVGVVMTLAGQARSSTADMGLIILAGIVVNNAIVLVDHINRLRRQGMTREEAVVLGGQHRLRPILMTAVTTILGLSPMVAPFILPQFFGQPEGRAAMWAPVSLVILGGLTTSTFLTLLVTPTIYTLLDDFTRFLRRVARTA
jgi:HAE1 family hydrophobic/amphiphilic exporter-1